MTMKYLGTMLQVIGLVLMASTAFPLWIIAICAVIFVVENGILFGWPALAAWATKGMIDASDVEAAKARWLKAPLPAAKPVIATYSWASTHALSDVNGPGIASARAAFVNAEPSDWMQPVDAALLERQIDALLQPKDGHKALVGLKVEANSWRGLPLTSYNQSFRSGKSVRKNAAIFVDQFGARAAMTRWVDAQEAGREIWAAALAEELRHHPDVETIENDQGIVTFILGDEYARTPEVRQLEKRLAPHPDRILASEL